MPEAIAVGSLGDARAGSLWPDALGTPLRNPDVPPVTPPRGVDDVDARQVRRLQQFLKYDLLVEFVAAAALLGMYAIFPSASLLIVGLLLSANTALLVWVRRRVDQGQVETAVTALALALWAICIAVGVLIPPAFVVAPLLLMLSVLVAVPYTTGRRLPLLILGAVAVALFLMTFARGREGPFEIGMLPDWFVLVVMAVSVPAAMGTILLFVWQYSQLLGETLAQTRQANAALLVSEHQLADKVQELQASRTRIVEAQEGVRRDIASHLHGRVQGRLLALRGRLLELLVDADLPAQPARHLRESADALASIVEEELSALSRRLYPSILRRGLVPALESLADQFEAVVDVALEIDPLLRQRERTDRDLLPEPTRLAAYRIAEEALNNTVKHAGATLVRLHLALTPSGTLHLSVADNGRGFEVNAVTSGLGLAAINDQAAVAGGTSDVRGAPGQGTEVVAMLPLTGRWPAPPPTGVTSA